MKLVVVQKFIDIDYTKILIIYIVFKDK